MKNSLFDHIDCSIRSCFVFIILQFSSAQRLLSFIQCERTCLVFGMTIVHWNHFLFVTFALTVTAQLFGMQRGSGCEIGFGNELNCRQRRCVLYGLLTRCISLRDKMGSFVLFVVSSSLLQGWTDPKTLNKVKINLLTLQMPMRRVDRADPEVREFCARQTMEA